MRRQKIGLVVLASCLAVAGCTTSDGPSPTPSPTLTPSPSTPEEPPVERRALMAYPDRPTSAWTFSAQDAGVDADGELALVDPTNIVQTTEGFLPPAPIDAGDMLILAVSAAGEATLVGIDADSGTAEWTYAPATGRLHNCAPDVLGSAIACAVVDPAGAGDAVIVLVDIESGEEVGQADLPGQPIEVAVGAGLVVALTDPGTMTSEGEARTYHVVAFAANGEQAWSTPVVYQPALGRGLSQDVEVGESLTAVEYTGSVYVLATEDGELLIQRDVGETPAGDGRNWSHVPLGAAVLVYDDAYRESPQVVVVGADGAELTVLSDHTRLWPILDADENPLLEDAEGEVVTVDPGTGATTGSGVPTNDSGAGAPHGSLVDGLVLVGGDTLRAYDLAAPGEPVWEIPLASPGAVSDALTDGSFVYSGGIAMVEAPVRSLVLSAVDLADGSMPWTLIVEPEMQFVQPTVARGGGRLVVINGGTITALAP